MLRKCKKRQLLKKILLELEKHRLNKKDKKRNKF